MGRTAAARARVVDAYRKLRSPPVQRRLLEAAKQHLRPVTRVLRCRIDVRAVNEMAVGWRRHIVATRHDGRSYDQTYGQMARNLIGAVDIDADDPTAGTLTIEYRHSATGQRSSMQGM